MRRAQTLLGAALCAGLMLAACGQAADSTPPVTSPENAAATATPSPTPTPTPAPMVCEARFSATGDNLIHEGLYYLAAERAQSPAQYDFTGSYEALLPFYAEHDINWINQETLVNSDYAPSGYPCFSTPAEMAQNLYTVGYRVFSLSNNHTYDKGAGGLTSSLAVWEALPEDAVAMGIYDLADPLAGIAYQEVNGLRLAYLSYTEMTNGIPTPAGSPYGVIYLHEEDVIRAQVEEARQNADFVVVSAHWGTEGSHAVNEAQRHSAQFLADCGADLVIGTHPHVVQNAEWLTGQGGNRTFVAYSLGNFLNLQSSADNMIGAILDLTFQKMENPDGSIECQILSPTLVPVVNHYESHYRNGRVYLLKDYTDELAAQHGVRVSAPDFGLGLIRSILTETISPEFLALPAEAA